MRLPDWCDEASITLNGQLIVLADVTNNGYAMLERTWQVGDQVCLHFPMKALVVRGNPLLRHVAGKIAIQRGPLVYCIEQADNGENLHNIELSSDATFEAFTGEGLFAGKTLLKTQATKITGATGSAALYQYQRNKPLRGEQDLILIPYFTWANRGEGEMRVWIDEV
jgi:DUF1680 family protein